MTPLHTDRTYEQQLGQLRTAVLEMGGLVEDQIAQAVKALVDRDERLARATIERDHTVNRFDVEIDDLSIKLLAPATQREGSRATAGSTAVTA